VKFNPVIDPIYIYIKNLKLYMYPLYKYIINIIWVKKIIHTPKSKITIDNIKH